MLKFMFTDICIYIAQKDICPPMGLNLYFLYIMFNKLFYSILFYAYRKRSSAHGLLVPTAKLKQYQKYTSIPLFFISLV